MNGSSVQLNPFQRAQLELQRGRISYDQYQQRVAELNGAPAPAAPAPQVVPTAPANGGNWNVNDTPLPPVPGGMTDYVTPQQVAQTMTPAGQPNPVSDEAKEAPAKTEAKAPVPSAGPSQPGAAGGAASMQGDPLAPLLRPQPGGAAHRVGYSPADKQMLGKLATEQVEGENREYELAHNIGRIADSFAAQNDALAAQSQQGAAEFAKSEQERAARRQQLDTDARESQTRIQGKLADLEAQGIDPGRYFQNMSTMGKIAQAATIGLSAFGAHALGPNGSPSHNVALEMMQTAIAQDIDSQRTNLQKSIELATKQGDFAAKGFDQQRALLEAERESAQAAYSIAANEVAKRMAISKDNAQVQTQGAQLIAGIQQSAAQRVGQLNEQIYGIQKAGEKVVGGGGTDVAKAIRERAFEFQKMAAANGRELTSEEAHRLAAKSLYGTDVAPGVAEPSISKEAKGEPGEKDKAAMVKQADELGANVAGKSTSLWTNPAEKAGTLFQGTEGQQYRLDQNTWNTFVKGSMHKMHGARTPEAQKELGEPFLIQPNDTPGTIERKTTAFQKYVRSAAPGTSPVAAELPEGLEEER